LRNGSRLGHALAALGALSAAPLVVPLSAQRVTVLEAGAGVALVMARHTMAGVEVGAGYRPGGQSRVALAVAAGNDGGRAAARAQVTAQFLVTPAARRGVGLYGGLGVAVSGRRGSPGGGYLALLVGVEAAPGGGAGAGGGRGGWYAELGLAGGARVAAGWRGRWFSGRRPGGGG
jgi:hypothetical protein